MKNPPLLVLIDISPCCVTLCAYYVNLSFSCPNELRSFLPSPPNEGTLLELSEALRGSQHDAPIAAKYQHWHAFSLTNPKYQLFAPVIVNEALYICFMVPTSN